MLRLLSARLSALAFSTLLISAIASGAARAEDCSSEKTLKSPPSNTPTELSFQNKSAEKRRIYWIDQEGDRKFYGIVEPGNTFRQSTMANHAWVVTDDAEKCLYAFVASVEPRVVDVGETAAVVVAPPPGGQTPIAQVPVTPPAPQEVVPPPPPAVVQAPPPAPPPPDTAAAPQQSAVEPLPQVSPVDQFQLRGTYRLAARLDNSKVLNNEASGTIDVIAASPEWDSAQWIFESVPGTPFVRIRNAWKKTYLADFNGKPRAMPASPDATEAHWTFEPVDGTNFVQFRNRETDRFLLSINGAAALVDDFRQDLENNSQWRTVAIAPGGRPVAAAPAAPRNQAYDLALADCREIGGYWTGTTCRRPAYLTEPLSCRRGFQWSEATSECEWIGGGNCPPWQMGPGGACRRDLVCRGGDVEISRNGYQACYCPRGTVAWGDYPYFSCVPSVSRVAPYLIPAVVGGAVLAIISGGKDRPQVGPVFGNKKFCGRNQTGTPPNCVAATTCQPPLVGTPPNCIRQMPRPNVTPTIAVTPTPTPNVTTTPVITPTPTPTPTVVTTTPVCQLGQTLVDGRCVNLNDSITCTGGRIEQGVCGCPSGTTLSGSGRTFQCVAANTAPTPTPTPTPTPGGTTTTPICPLGQTAVNGSCVSLNDSITCTGGRIEQGVCGCPSGTKMTGSGRNFQCVAANTGGVTVDPTDPKTGQPTQTCGPGFTGSPPNCTKQGDTTTTQPVGGPPVCADGQNTASGCRCAAPLTILPGGKCAQPTARGAACLEGQNIAQTGCNCVAPLKPIENGFCGRLLLNETKPISKGGTCTEGQDIVATKCTCLMKTVDQGGKFICSANATAQPINNNPGGGGPPVCADGQNTASGCRCAAPLTVLPGGKCTQPTARGAACLEGQNIAQTGCTCAAPLKPIENGFCGRLLLNETKPISKGGTCTEGQDIVATKCTCLMKTVDQGGKFICSANAAPSGVKLAPPPRPGTTMAPAPTPTSPPTSTTLPPPPPKPVATPSPTPTVAPKPVVTPSPTPTTAPKPVEAPTPKPESAPRPKPLTTPPPPPKPVTAPPPKPVTAPPPKPVTAPPPPKPVTVPPPKQVTAPPPPPRPVTPPPPPPKPVMAPPPPPKPATPPPPACAPPKKINPAGQCV